MNILFRAIDRCLQIGDPQVRADRLHSLLKSAQAVTAEMEPNATPCIGSGFCCRSYLCPIALIEHTDHRGGPCPSLVEMDGVWRCGLYRRALDGDLGKHCMTADQIKDSMGFGKGCCEPDARKLPG